jgi:hypothetical protein
MTDLEKLSEQTDTSIEILRAIVDQQGDDQDAIEETLENPADFDALVARARKYAGESGHALRWHGRAII